MIIFALQCRSQSTRLPGKIYKTIGDKSLLEWVHEAALGAHRVLNVKGVQSKVVILGPENDTELKEYCLKKGFNYLCPKVDENDLVKRYLEAALTLNADYIVRITSDCFLTDKNLVAEMAYLMQKEKLDYVSNTVVRSFIEGMDLQMCSKKAMQWFDDNQKEDREHPFLEFDTNAKTRKEFERAKMKWLNMANPRNEVNVRTSIDTQADLDRANEFYDAKFKTKII